jgi:serine/threonine-protein kinase
MSEIALQSLGRYRIVSELGRGTMGVVYKALDPQLDRAVAIKTIRVSTNTDELAEYLARFRQEAKALGGLNHPAIITVFDVGNENDIAYMAMELLDGVELRDLLAQSRLPVRLVTELAAQVADGLAFAHERGIVHRDIKPSNIMVVQGERAKIMDFGIARVRVSDIKTQTGMLLGSPKYMSPEQVLGRPLDHRSDIFSLGVVLYEMLAGLAPFSGADISQLMYQVVNGRPVPPSSINPASPELLDFIVAKALEKDPEDRYQDAVELADDLRLCRDSLPQAPARGAAGSGGDTLPLEGDPSPAGREVETSGRTWSLAEDAPRAARESVPDPRDPGPGTAAASPARQAAGPAREAESAAMPAAKPVSATPAGIALGLRPSPRPDSSTALARLQRPGPADRALLSPEGPVANRLDQFRRDFIDLLGVIAVLGIASALAFALAFL